MLNAKGASTQTVAGTLSLRSGIHYVRSTGTTADYTGSGGANSVRNIIFTALVSGGPDSAAHFLRNGTFTLGNAGNTFAGTWRAGGSAGHAGRWSQQHHGEQQFHHHRLRHSRAFGLRVSARPRLARARRPVFTPQELIPHDPSFRVRVLRVKPRRV